MGFLEGAVKGYFLSLNRNPIFFQNFNFFFFKGENSRGFFLGGPGVFLGNFGKVGAGKKEGVYRFPQKKLPVGFLGIWV